MKSDQSSTQEIADRIGDILDRRRPTVLEVHVWREDSKFEIVWRHGAHEPYRVRETCSEGVTATALQGLIEEAHSDRYVVDSAELYEKGHMHFRLIERI